MRYSLQIPYQDEKQFMAVYGEKTFSERLAESASKKILKEEEEQKAKEQEEQKLKEEEERKLKEIKDEKDAELTALISYFYNRN